MKFLLLTLVGLLTACSAAPSAPTAKAAPTQLNLTDADAGSTVAVAKGGIVSVALAGNPTTGYTWVLLSASDTVLQPKGEPVYTPKKAPAAMTGSGGFDTFTFRAIAPGTANLKFGYRRSFEKDTPPALTVEMTVRVE